MVLSIKSRSGKAGMPPGTLVHIGEERKGPVGIAKISYDSAGYDEKAYADIGACMAETSDNRINWINIDGIHDTGVVGAVGKAYGVHPLVLEDIMNSDQRPKFESFDGYLFLTCRMIYPDRDGRGVNTEQLSLLVAANTVISFQEEPGDVFNAVRDRIRGGMGRIRSMNSGYLAYSLLDCITDSYFSVMEQKGYEIDELEERLSDGEDDDIVKKIHGIRNDIIMIRKSVWPLREIILGMEKDDAGLMGGQTSRYLRDVYDHTIQVMDTIETFREILTGMMDLYLSGVSNRMNRIMKVLTIISTTFIPMTFIAGIYGMNFKNMPGLQWDFGYYFALLLMLGVFAAMLFFFKRKKWF